MSDVVSALCPVCHGTGAQPTSPGSTEGYWVPCTACSGMGAEPIAHGAFFADLECSNSVIELTVYPDRIIARADAGDIEGDVFMSALAGRWPGAVVTPRWAADDWAAEIRPADDPRDHVTVEEARWTPADERYVVRPSGDDTYPPFSVVEPRSEIPGDIDNEIALCWTEEDARLIADLFNAGGELDVAGLRADLAAAMQREALLAGMVIEMGGELHRLWATLRRLVEVLGLDVDADVRAVLDAAADGHAPEVVL